jgi:hypothetical protein
MKDKSTTQISSRTIKDVIEALSNIRGWGSVEIFVQDFQVVQIIERNIKKTLQQERSNGQLIKGS